MEKKIRITKAQKYSAIKTLLTDNVEFVPITSGTGDNEVTYHFTTADAIEFVDAEVELLSRKGTSARKPTEAQKANESYKELIVEYLNTLDTNEEHPGATCTELSKNIPELSEFNNQKISGLIRGLKASGLVEPVTKKGVTYFRVV